MSNIADEARLCYVTGDSAYFTTRSLEQQWGDDWDDAPYEHNAGRPYTWSGERDGAPWRIVEVKWEGDYETPCDGHVNSQWSVLDINRKAIAWLRPSQWWQNAPAPIYAGTTLRQFIDHMAKAGCSVYAPRALWDEVAELGSHAADLKELRACQDELDRLRKDKDRLVTAIAEIAMLYLKHCIGTGSGK